jgi:hypothetical protein
VNNRVGMNVDVDDEDEDDEILEMDVASPRDTYDESYQVSMLHNLFLRL